MPRSRRPELDQQLQQARAQLTTDEANLKLAEITADRYTGLLKQDSIAKQDVDNAVQNAAARKSTVESAKANVARLEETVGYEKVYAPFDGVVTARNIDVGALINAGANTPGKELFHLASNSTLRVYVNVPEAYSRATKEGVQAYVTLGRVSREQVRRNGGSKRECNRYDLPNAACGSRRQESRVDNSCLALTFPFT